MNRHLDPNLGWYPGSLTKREEMMGLTQEGNTLGHFTRLYCSGIFYLVDEKYSLKPEKGTRGDLISFRAGIYSGYRA